MQNVKEIEQHKAGREEVAERYLQNYTKGCLHTSILKTHYETYSETSKLTRETATRRDRRVRRRLLPLHDGVFIYLYDEVFIYDLFDGVFIYDLYD
jgi:hypothetical protein